MYTLETFREQGSWQRTVIHFDKNALLKTKARISAKNIQRNKKISPRLEKIMNSQKNTYLAKKKPGKQKEEPAFKRWNF